MQTAKKPPRRRMAAEHAPPPVRRRLRETVALPEIVNPEQRLRLREVSALTGWGRTKVYDEVKKGRLPAPEKTSPRCARWRYGSLLDALDRLRRSSESGA